MNKRNRRISAVVVLLLLLVAGIWWNLPRTEEASAPEPVVTAAPAPKPVVSKAPAPKPVPKPKPKPSCFVPDKKFPSVVWKGKVPVVKVPGSPALTVLTPRECRVGTGAVVTKDSTLIVKYVDATWEENRTGKKTLETVWDEPFDMGHPLKDAALPWKTLIGKRVGAQVLIVAPPGKNDVYPEGAHFIRLTNIFFVEIVGVQTPTNP